MIYRNLNSEPDGRTDGNPSRQVRRAPARRQFLHQPWALWLAGECGRIAPLVPCGAVVTSCAAAAEATHAYKSRVVLHAEATAIGTLEGRRSAHRTALRLQTGSPSTS